MQAPVSTRLDLIFWNSLPINLCVSQGEKISKSTRKRWNKRIKQSNLADYNAWLSAITSKMEEAHGRGDTETVYRLVRKISGDAKAFSSKTPSKDKSGSIIMDQVELAKM